MIFFESQLNHICTHISYYNLILLPVFSFFFLVNLLSIYFLEVGITTFGITRKNRVLTQHPFVMLPNMFSFKMSFLFLSRTLDIKDSVVALCLWMLLFLGGVQKLMFAVVN